MNNAHEYTIKKFSGHTTDLFWRDSALKCLMAVSDNDNTILALFSES